MEKVILLRELISLIKEIKKLDKWKVNQDRRLERIHTKWLMLLNESPDHKKRIGQVNVANLQQIITIGKIGFNWEKEHKFVAERYEAAKTDLILLITEQIKNPD